VINNTPAYGITRGPAGLSSEVKARELLKKQIGDETNRPTTGMAGTSDPMN
jgi:hypothetical protein